MDFNRIMVRELYKMGYRNKIICGNVVGNVSPYIEWIKWLSYESEFEKEKIQYLNCKSISELSEEESYEINRYNRNRIFAKLFKIYGTSECSYEDYMKVYDYMRNESIEELMLSKLTNEELEHAKQEIVRLSKISKEELSDKVKGEQKPEIYEQLSMVDSYILHKIFDINYIRGINNLQKEID